MLIPKQRLYNEATEEDFYWTVKYSVYDTEDCAFVENQIYTIYDTKEECQKDINIYNSFKII